MSLLKVIILAIVQGLAELLPDRQREFSLEYALGAVRFT